MTPKVNLESAKHNLGGMVDSSPEERMCSTAEVCKDKINPGCAHCRIFIDFDRAGGEVPVDDGRAWKMIVVNPGIFLYGFIER